MFYIIMYVAFFVLLISFAVFVVFLVKGSQSTIIYKNLRYHCPVCLYEIDYLEHNESYDNYCPVCQTFKIKEFKLSE